MSDSTTLLPTDSPACCLGCKYPLRELTVNRCPECGREFDPNDSKTMYWGRIPGRIGRALLRPPSLVLQLASGSIVAGLLYEASAPVGGFSPVFDLGFRILFLLIIVWLVRVLIALLLARYYAIPITGSRAAGRRWTTMPVVILLCAFLIDSGVPLHIRFWISRPAMDRLAQEIMQLPLGGSKWPNQNVGLYRTYRIDRLEGGMRFLVTYKFSGCGGFAYLTDQAPASVRTEYEHYSGPWYLWYAGRE
jgi:hypothetical protein